MKESKVYKTYLSYDTSAVPPKDSRKFKKASLTKKDSIPVQADEETVQKGKRVKRATKKPSTTPATGIVIREPTAKPKSKRKEKEKVNVACGKGIELLSEVSLTEKGSVERRTGDKPGVSDVTNDDSSKSKSESWGNDRDEQELDLKQDEESNDDDQEQEDFD
ncbi:hypothetical protein Tco_1335913 [Tanacetum coccineum]